MLVRAVTAHAFGPFAGERLGLADGLTVVHGPNESGKSTWHAALYLALCGRRRGRGASGPEQKVLADRHRPWDRDEWLVSAEVVLDDGRRVEFRQDLDGRVDCHARDLVVGTDLSAEFMVDGMPDASRWLGLDRHSFAATACIGQAQMLSVLERAGALQEHLQRAAATAGADSTAAAALARLKEYRAEHVGGDRAPTRPLRRAMAEAQSAREGLEEARTGHALYQRRVVEVDRLRAVRREAEHRQRLHEAAAAALVARDLRVRTDEAVELHTRLGGAEPPSEAADSVLAEQVAAALAAWSAQAEAPSPVPAPARASGHSAARTVDDAADDAADAELWELAAILDAPDPVDGDAAARSAAARERLTTAVRARTRRRGWLAGAAVAALAAAALIVRGDLVVGVALAAAAGLLALVGLRQRTADDPRAVRAEVESLRVEVAAARQAAEQTSARRAAATDRCVRLGLPAEPTALRALARERSGGVVVATRETQWRDEWRQARERAGRQVLAAAAACGPPAATPEDAVVSLRRWTAERASRLSGADEARRAWARLQSLLDDRPIEELTDAADAAQRRAAAAASGLTADELASVSPVDDETLAQLRAAAQTAAEEAVRAQAALRERSGSLPSVAEAEERVVRAEAALAQVRRLDETLDLTRRFLADAQERAHRDIAPVLAHSVRRALPEVTAGRYTDCIVNPATLQVMVCGPTRRWRDASLLSHGTAEQIYLLLRIALAQALARDGRVCPLLLDDVTVHADAERSVAVLELLLRASAERQIVLFTQQSEVRDWARTRLTGPRDALIELAPVATV
jgi:DNA repair protein SbcC/Rad50